MAIPNPGITEVGRTFVGAKLDEVGRFALNGTDPLDELGRFIFTTVSIETTVDELCFINNGWEICIPRMRDMP